MSDDNLTLDLTTPEEEENNTEGENNTEDQGQEPDTTAEEEAAAEQAKQQEEAAAAAAEEEAAAAAAAAAEEQVEQPVEQAEQPDVQGDEQPEESSGLTDDLKQRIAELDYLRECCGNWVGSGRAGKRNFLTAWESKSVSVDSNVNYEDTLDQLEKLPEIILKWNSRLINFKQYNYFKNIQPYTLDKPLFNGKGVTECVEVLEQLVSLLTKCANEKMNKNQIIDFIDNLY